METKKVKYYRFWGVDFCHNPSYFERGLWMLIVVILFPIWVWFYLGYMLIREIGKLDNSPKIIEKEELEEDIKQTYY